MQTVLPGLYAAAPQRLSFAPSLAVRAFLLQRPQGNLLVYNVNTLADDLASIEELGGISRHYLNHWHEAAAGGDGIAKAADLPTYLHQDDRDSLSDGWTVAGTFASRHLQDDDFEVVPIPGHTRGATAFLWHGGGHRYLFTGDSVYLRRSEWVAAVLEGSSDRDAYIDSLARLKELDFDVLVPWAASVDEPCYAITDQGDAGRRIDAILERLHRGEDH